MAGRAALSRVAVLPAQINVLAALACAEGHGHVDRLIQDFASGNNRFDGRGEALFVATINRQLVGVGGVNQDPYDERSGAGRVRRVYVHPRWRRRGIAARLMACIEAHACHHFEWLNLFTSSPSAGEFYLSLGFQAVRGAHKISHRKRLSRAALPDHLQTVV